MFILFHSYLQYSNLTIYSFTHFLFIHSFIMYFFIFFLIYYAFSITISNTTRFVGLYSYLFFKIVYLLYTQVNVSFACYFIFYEFSRCMLSTNLLKMLVYLLIRVSLFTGQFSVHNISAFSSSLSCFTRS